MLLAYYINVETMWKPHIEHATSGPDHQRIKHVAYS